jgi:hypothetical protein
MASTISLSKDSQAFKLFSEGKKPIEVKDLSLTISTKFIWATYKNLHMDDQTCEKIIREAVENDKRVTARRYPFDPNY